MVIDLSRSRLLPLLCAYNATYYKCCNAHHSSCYRCISPFASLSVRHSHLRVAISFKAIPYLFHLTRRNNFHFTRPDIYVQLFFRVDLEIFNDKFVWKCIEERIGRRNKGIRRAEGKFCKENSSNKTIRYKNYCLSLNRLNLKIDLIIYSTV